MRIQGQFLRSTYNRAKSGTGPDQISPDHPHMAGGQASGSSGYLQLPARRLALAPLKGLGFFDPGDDGGVES